MMDHDHELVRYLLHLLPADQAEHFDELSVSDDAFATRLRTVEDDLVDAYIGGEMRAPVLSQFEEVYLATPRRREKIAFARELRRVAGQTTDGAGKEAASASPPAIAVAAASPTASTSSRPVAFAARVLVPALLTVVCAILIVDRVRLRREVDQVRIEMSTLDRQLRDLQRQHDRMSPDSSTTAAGVPLVLLPQTSASASATPLDLAAVATEARFKLRLHANDFSSYQAALSDPVTRQVLWHSEWLPAAGADGAFGVNIHVPADLLKPQRYALALSGRGASGASEPVATYTFERLPR